MNITHAEKFIITHCADDALGLDIFSGQCAIDEMDELGSTTVLGELVDEKLCEAGEYAAARGETYLETAARVADKKPELAKFLRAAELKWFELGG